MRLRNGQPTVSGVVINSDDRPVPPNDSGWCVLGLSGHVKRQRVGYRRSNGAKSLRQMTIEAQNSSPQGLIELFRYPIIADTDCDEARPSKSKD
jgi:hypothetical protein